jgi:hypothetical protein
MRRTARWCFSAPAEKLKAGLTPKRKEQPNQRRLAQSRKAAKKSVLKNFVVSLLCVFAALREIAFAFPWRLCVLA